MVVPRAGRAVRAGLLLVVLLAALLTSSVAVAGPSRPIAFVKNGELHVATISGGRIRKLTSTGGNVRSASWFPDGKRLAYVRDGYADGSTDLWGKTLRVVSVDTRKVKALKLTMPKLRYTDGGETGYLDWKTLDVRSIAVSPDGGRLVAVVKGTDTDGLVQGYRVLVFQLSTRTGKEIGFYSAYDHDSVDAGWKSNSTVWIGRYWGDGAKFATVKAGGGTSRAVNVPSAAALAWSPDGKRLAWGQDKGDYGDAANSIRLSDSSGGTGRTLAGGATVGEIWWTPLSWSSDAKYVFAVTDRGLYRIRTSGGQSRCIVAGVTEVNAWKAKRK